MKLLETHTAKTSQILPRTDDVKKQRLQKAAKDFESLFMEYMLKTMRTSIPESGLFGENIGGDMFESLFDSQLASYSSKNGSLGIAKMLYKKLTGEELNQSTPTVPIQKVSVKKNVNQTTQVQKNPKINAAVEIQKKGESSVQPKLSQVISVIQQPMQSDTTEQVPIKSVTHGKIQEPYSAKSNTRVNFKPSASLEYRLDQFQSIIDTAAQRHGVDSTLVKAMIASESGGRVNAQSSANAKGLMQLIDSTAAAMGVKNVLDPKDNINGGVKYIKQLLETFDGDLNLALASYNAGPGAIKKHNGIPPYKETREYINRVMNYMQYFQQQEISSNEE